MTPNFALSLSFEGIRLMHRVSGGWHLVGEAALDDPDLTGTLARLRQTALALEPAGLRTKLLLPNDQIKYLSIDGTRTSEAEVHAALEGTTPYAIADLVVDHNRSGGRTHIAAVARETLAEAEAFATQHRFAPVTFAAVAEPYTFNTEVFFGMTEAAPGIVGDGIEIARDDDPVSVIGHASMPTPADLSDAMPLTTQVMDEPVAVAPDPEPQITETPPEPAVDEPVLSFGRSAWRPEDDAKEAPATEVEEAPAEPEPEPDPEVEPEALPEIEDVVFSSRIPRQNLAADPEPAPPAPIASALDEPLPPEPQFTRRRDAALTPGIADIPVAEADAPAVPEPIVVASTAATAPPPIASAPAPVATPAAPPVPAAVPVNQPDDASASAGIEAAVSGYLARRKAKRKARAAPVPTGIGPIGGKHAQQIGGKPKYLGLMLTVGLLVFLALVALWASTLDEDGIAGLLGLDDDAPTELAVTEPDIITPELETAATPELIATAPTVAPEPEIVTPDAPTTPIVTTVPGRVLSPGEAERIYAATGVWQRAPRLPFEPEETTLDGIRILAAAQIVPPISRPRDLAAAAQGIEAPFLAPPNPAPAGTVIPRDDNGFILASAQGTVMPNGVLVYARAPRIEPPTRPEALVPAAASVPEETITPDVTPEADDAVDVAAAAVAAALAGAGQPAPEDATDPAATEGLNVVAGRPSLEPPARPDSIEEAALGTDEAAPEDDADVALVANPALAGFRPALRPEGLAPEAPFADPELAGLRPSLRPANLAPPEPDETDNASIEEAVAAASTTPDLNSVIATIAAAAPPSALVNPTRQAIVASPRPDTRPSNFSRVVSAAQARPAATTQASAPAVAASAAVRPTGAVPQSVASAATQDGAINLGRVNLIGVYGRPNDRRALIRLANGRYVKVEVGTSLEGGRVTAIGDSALNYVVGGQTYSLQVPSG